MKLTVTKEEERDFLFQAIDNTRRRISAIRQDAERRVSWEEGHIGYLLQRIRDLGFDPSEGGQDGRRSTAD